MALLQQFAALFTIRTADPDVRRRGRNVIILALGLAGFGLILLSFILSLSERRPGLALLSVLFIVQVCTIVLARRGLVNAAALLMISMAIIGPVLAQWLVRAALSIPFQLIIPLLFASVTLRPRMIWIVLGATLGGLVVMRFVSASLSAEILREVFVTSGGLLVLVALIGILGSASTERALAAAAQARAESEEAMHLLALTNAQLEQRVAARTHDLTASLATQAEQAATLRSALANKQALDALIAELSLPIIPVRHDTLVVPLIGALDAERTTTLIERVLQAVEAQRAQRLIVDVTGVPIIDTAVAGALITLTNAVRLLGANVTLVGVRPEVAQALVSLGVDLGELRSAATLQQGLEHIHI